MDVTLQFSATFWIPLLVVALALGFTFFIYRHTLPACSSLLRRALATLRYGSLAIVLLLLFEPIVGLRWTTSRPPTLAVLIDESASMTLADSTTRRSAAVQNCLRQPWLAQVQKSMNVEIFAFADSLRALPVDSLAALRFTGDGTDIAGALVAAHKRLAAENFAAVLLLSDGGANLGENPARVAQNYPVPIFSVGIGSPPAADGPNDVVLSQVVTNDIAYAETELPVEVTIAAVGYAGRMARLRLEDASGLLAEQEVVLPADNTQTTAKLTILPRQLGVNKFTAVIEAQAGEAIPQNNRRSAFVRVLKSKVRVWIVAGAPSADYEFAKRTLEEDKNFVVTGFVQKPDGSFYDPAMPATLESKAWQEVDCLIPIDFPRRETDPRLIAGLAQLLATSNKPVFWMAGPDVDPVRWWNFEKSLPLAIKPSRVAENLVSVVPDPSYAHPLSRLVDSPEDNRQLWSNLPPLFFSFANVKASVSAQIIARAEGQMGRGTVPVLLAQKSADSKSLLLLAYGVWRWHLKLVGIGKEPIAYRQLMAQGVRWLVTKEDTKIVRFSTNKHVYRSAEPVQITAQVYYEDYRPRAGAQVSARIIGQGLPGPAQPGLGSGPVLGQGYDRELLFEEVGDGLYRASPGSLPGGDYELRGRAEQNGQLLGDDVARFSVEPFSVEYLAPAMNQTLLRRLAEVSGGRYLAPDSLGQFAATANFPAHEFEEGKEIAAWGRPAVLLLVLALLAGEWFLRKRKGML